MKVKKFIFEKSVRNSVNSIAHSNRLLYYTLIRLILPPLLFAQQPHPQETLGGVCTQRVVCQPPAVFRAGDFILSPVQTGNSSNTSFAAQIRDDHNFRPIQLSSCSTFCYQFSSHWFAFEFWTAIVFAHTRMSYIFMLFSILRALFMFKLRVSYFARKLQLEKTKKRVVEWKWVLSIHY